MVWSGLSNVTSKETTRAPSSRDRVPAARQNISRKRPFAQPGRVVGQSPPQRWLGSAGVEPWQAVTETAYPRGCTQNVSEIEESRVAVAHEGEDVYAQRRGLGCHADQKPRDGATRCDEFRGSVTRSVPGGSFGALALVLRTDYSRK